MLRWTFGVVRAPRLALVFTVGVEALNTKEKLDDFAVERNSADNTCTRPNRHAV